MSETADIKTHQRVARKLGQEAGQACADKQEQATPGFSERAYAFIVEYIAVHGPISGELVTNAAKMAGIRPADDRAFGSIYARALREDAIRIVGSTTRIKGHGTGGARVYAAGGV
ncbi:hypothetical protein E8K88_11865 [Lampropedia aestuarii]|uniref:Uncharacterized protein n=1 Tax=Lampropedia aestuarii TaxID=2562762 RepID=A0A4S5BNE6_9BURK|nr:hypothetical protein [Lampropedia aestuarii]THJ32391.1 hypothetical protein E8K88_11865 [Lampropedia aestuarii]